MKKKLVVGLAIGIFCGGIANIASATTLTFEDLPGDSAPVPSGYGGFN